MSRNRVLYTPERVRQLVANLRADDYAASYETLCELKRLQTEVSELRAVIAEMRAARLAVERAETELDALRRQRSINRAPAQERDPAQPLN